MGYSYRTRNLPRPGGVEGGSGGPSLQETSSSSGPSRAMKPPMETSCWHIRGSLFARPTSIAGSAADAEDAAQEGFVKAWSALQRFRTGPVSALDPADRRQRSPQPPLRAAGRRAHLTLRTVAGTPSGGRRPLSPEATAIDTEQREELLAAVNELREEDRLVIACRYFLELSEEKTAQRSVAAAARSSPGSHARSGGCAMRWGRRMPELELALRPGRAPGLAGAPISSPRSRRDPQGPRASKARLPPGHS